MEKKQHVYPNDHGYDGEIVTEKLKVKAHNEPGDLADIGQSNMPNGDMPTGDATDSVLGDK